MNFQTHETLSDLSPVLGSLREPLSDESHIPPGAANSDNENPLSIIYPMVVHANNHRFPPMPERRKRKEELPHAGNHRTTSTTGTGPGEPVFSVATRRIDEIAEVT